MCFCALEVVFNLYFIHLLLLPDSDWLNILKFIIKILIITINVIYYK